jgi:hypothetical protein
MISHTGEGRNKKVCGHSMSANRGIAIGAKYFAVLAKEMQSGRAVATLKVGQVELRKHFADPKTLTSITHF